MKKFPGVTLNAGLVEKQGLSERDINDITKLHELKHYVFQIMDSVKGVTDDDRLILLQCVDMVEKIEYKLQQTWKFKIDRSWHNWYEVPKCGCPKMDNRGYKGVGDYRIINRDCILHGNRYA